MSVADFNKYVNQPLSVLRFSPVASGLLKLALIMYGGLAAPKMAQKYQSLFQNPIFRLVVMAVAIWTVEYDVGVAIIIAVIFILSINKWAPSNKAKGAKPDSVTASGKKVTRPVHEHAQEVTDGPQAYVPDDVMMLASADQ
jgi:hypothetical protein